jgi:hypothetical protein
MKKSREAAKPKVKPNFILKSPSKSVAVFTRNIKLVTGGRAVWGDVRRWAGSDDPARNVKNAIAYALRYLNEKGIGTIVYVVGKGWREPMPIYEAKKGNDGIPYTAWKSNPAATWWRDRRIGHVKPLPALKRRLY